MRMAVRAFHAEAKRLELRNMATVQLKNIKKVYPFISGEQKKPKKKIADDPKKKKVNLQITDEGVVAVQEFNLGQYRTERRWCGRARSMVK